MSEATATRMQALRAELGQVSGVVASPPPGEGAAAVFRFS